MPQAKCNEILEISSHLTSLPQTYDFVERELNFTLRGQDGLRLEDSLAPVGILC